LEPQVVRIAEVAETVHFYEYDYFVVVTQPIRFLESMIVRCLDPLLLIVLKR